MGDLSLGWCVRSTSPGNVPYIGFCTTPMSPDSETIYPSFSCIVVLRGHNSGCTADICSESESMSIESHSLIDAANAIILHLTSKGISEERTIVQIRGLTAVTQDVIIPLSIISSKGIRIEMKGCRFERISVIDVQLARCDFSDSTFRYCQFQNSDLSFSNFSGCRFFGTIISDCFLYAADFSRADFRGATLTGQDLSTCASLTDTRWNGTRLDRTLLSASQLGGDIRDEPKPSRHRSSTTKDGRTRISPTEYSDARKAYRALKWNFSSTGSVDDAAWAHFKELQMQRCELLSQVRPKQIRSYSSAIGVAGLYILEVTMGYGFKLWRPVWCSAATVLLFAVLYSFFGVIDPSFDGGSPTPKHDILASILYSSATFFTMNFNTMEPVGSLGRGLTVIEAMLGLFFMAEFIFNLGARASRS